MTGLSIVWNLGSCEHWASSMDVLERADLSRPVLPRFVDVAAVDTDNERGAGGQPAFRKQIF